MLTTQGEESEFRLPRLDNNPARQQVRSKAEARNKSPLPSLKKSTQSNYDVSAELPSKRSFGDKEREDFAIEI